VSNMTYCRFRNTLPDLRDCADAMWETDVSPEEHEARRQLIQACRDIVAEADDNEWLEEPCQEAVEAE